MIFNSEEKVETPLLCVPLPTEQHPKASLRNILEPSPPSKHRKATKPPKPIQHTPMKTSLTLEVEQLLDRVYSRAEALLLDCDEKPLLHDLMRALDLILQEDSNNSQKFGTEVANTVYRLLIKKEKQKAYESLVSI